MNDTIQQTRQKICTREKIPGDTKHYIYNICGKKCAHCGMPLDYVKDFTIDHVIPLSKGGTNDPENLVALCEVCNQKKGNNVIAPLDYFSYLTENKEREVQAVFEKYLASFDWIAFDNLFMTDWFDIKFQKYLTKKNRPVIGLPGKAHVQRIPRHDAFLRLQDYVKGLDKKDRSLIVSSEEDTWDAYYAIIVDNKEIGFFSAEITEPGSLTPWNKWAYMVNLDLFIHFDVKYRGGITFTLISMMESLVGHIQDTLLHNSEGSAIPITVRMPETANHAQSIWYFADKQYKNGLVKCRHSVPQEGMWESRILYITYIAAMHPKNREALILIKDNDDGRYFLHDTEVFPEQLQKGILERLTRSHSIQTKLKRRE